MDDGSTPFEDGIRKHGGVRTAARAAGMARTTYRDRLTKERAEVAARAASGVAPEYDLTHPIAPGYRLKGASSYYNKDGVLSGQWVKSQIDPGEMEGLQRAALEAMSDDIIRAKPVAQPSHANADLLTCYVLTDYHLGMLSWGEETGADWDLQIASNLLAQWLEAAIEQSPRSGTAILAQLGDFLHYDGLEAVTPSSKHVLDADSRFQKVVRVAIHALRRAIAALLERHEHVRVLACEGNHDIASSVWLREMLSVLYENDPRVTVDRSPDPFYAYEHGETALFFHHGHKAKIAQLPSVFASKFRAMFGRTKHAYGHIGHYHHGEVKESALMVVEQHRTLAAKDAYASRGGYLSGRSAAAITYHKKYGEVSRIVLSPEAVMDC